MITFTRHFRYLGSYILITTLNTESLKLPPQWELSTVFGLRIQLTIFKISIFLRNSLQFTSVGKRELGNSKSNVKEIGRISSQKCKKKLKITITMVIDEQITNESVRKRFFNIPTIWYQLAKRQLTFIGKVVRNSEDQIPTQLLTAWCDNKCKPGAPLQNNKKNLTPNIQLIVPGAEKYGLLTT